jgi:hypothetical protein
MHSPGNRPRGAPRGAADGPRGSSSSFGTGGGKVGPEAHPGRRVCPATRPYNGPGACWWGCRRSARKAPGGQRSVASAPSPVLGALVRRARAARNSASLRSAMVVVRCLASSASCRAATTEAGSSQRPADGRGIVLPSEGADDRAAVHVRQTSSGSGVQMVTGGSSTRGRRRTRERGDGRAEPPRGAAESTVTGVRRPQGPIPSLVSVALPSVADHRETPPYRLRRPGEGPDRACSAVTGRFGRGGGRFARGGGGVALLPVEERQLPVDVRRLLQERLVVEPDENVGTRSTRRSSTAVHRVTVPAEESPSPVAALQVLRRRAGSSSMPPTLGTDGVSAHRSQGSSRCAGVADFSTRRMTRRCVSRTRPVGQRSRAGSVTRRLPPASR